MDSCVEFINNLNKYKMTDRELLKEARDLIVMCSLLDKSNQCSDMADKIDKQLAIPVVSDTFSADDMRIAFEDGEHYGKGGDALIFDIENYR